MSKANMVTYKAVVWDVMQLIFENFNDHQLHCVVYFDSHIDKTCLKKAIDRSLDSFPLIRSKFIEKSYFKFPYWEDCKFTSEDIVNEIETEDIEKTIEKLIIYKTKETCGPQMRVNIIRSIENDTLCIVMNHMISDGVGFKQYLYMLSSMYSHFRSDFNYTPDIKMGSRSTNQIFKRFNILNKIKILSASAQLSKYDSGATFSFEGDNNNPFVVIRKILPERFLFIKAYAKENNATLNDVLLAAYIRALYKVLKIDHISLPCPIDLRRYLPNKRSEGICNLTSNMICDIGSDIGDTYKETLLKVRKSMNAEKDSFSCLNGPFMLEMLFRILPYKKAKQIVSKIFNNPPIAMTNIGIIHKNKFMFDGLNIKDTFISGSIKYKPYFQIAITTFDNKITLSVNFYGTKNDRIKITEFLSVFDSEMPVES